MRREESPDSQVRVGPRRLRDQRVGGFPDTVVHEPVGAIQALDEFQANRLPQVPVDLFLRCPAHERERLCVRTVAEAGELLQPLLRRGRQPVQLSDHQVDDVGRVPLRVDALEVPRPACRLMVEREQPLVGESGDELDHEERVAARLLAQQLRQRGGARRLAAKRIRDELTHVLTGEGRQPDFL